MAYSYKGSISFGLVYIPVTLQACVKNNDISFNMLDKKTMSRIKYKKTCVDCGGREIKNEDVVKAYQYDDDRYVIFEDTDFEKIKSVKDKNITVEKFVDIGQIDPIYFDKPYYVVPVGGDKAFALLVKAMAQQNKAGIAKAVLGTKETLIALRVKDGQMLLNTLFFEEEIQQNPAKKADDNVSEKELALAKTLIGAMEGEFKPEEYKDEYREKVVKAIEEKIAGKEISIPAKEKAGGIIDLMEALQKSLLATSTEKMSSKPKKSSKDVKTQKLKKAQ